MNNTLVLGVAGSPRSKIHTQQIKKMILNINDITMLKTVIEKVARDQILSNTDIALLAAMYGVKENNVDFEIISLKQFFMDDSVNNSKRLEKLIKSAGGIVISSPVYFGDKSNLVELFINYLKKKSLVQGKVVGSISAGAKRNGGQETTNVFILKELSDAGAYVVGNGPPTSQYGGTVWAGNIGTIREDDFGITTSVGTGKKVADIVLLMNLSHDDSKETLHVSFWITKDCKNIVMKKMEKFANCADKTLKQAIKWDIVNFTKINLYSCRACSRCPFYSKNSSLYKCVINNDDLKDLYERIIKTDAIVICGYQSNILEGIKDVYQKVLERTRVIRRDNFLLTDIPIMPFLIKEVPGNSLFSLKVMTSFLRHNTVIFPSSEMILNDKTQIINSENNLVAFLRFASQIKSGKKTNVNVELPFYMPIGY